MKYLAMTPEQKKRHTKAMGVVITLCAGIWILIGGIWLAARGNSTDCIRFLQWSLIPIGVTLLAIVFFAGCYGVRNDDGCLQGLYIFVLFFAVLAFVAFMIFGFVAVGVNIKDDEPAREYKLSDYGGWLRGRLADTQYWATVSACLRDRHACDGMKRLVRDPDTSLLVPENADLSPIQSGCCKPPSSCAFTYVNGTMWTTTPSVPAMVTDEVDCSRWRDDQQMLCFQCDSCKAGVLEDIKKAWSNLAIPYTFLVMIPLVCSYPCQVKAFME